MQLLFNEVSMFTFSKGTHGFDVRVPKNYLNCCFSLTYTTHYLSRMAWPVSELNQQASLESFYIVDVFRFYAVDLSH